MTLTDAQVERYSRQILLPEVGGRGQERLLASRVVVAGEGPAALSAAMLLGRAGIGALVVPESLPPLPELSPECRLSRVPRHRETPGGADVVVALMEPGCIPEDAGVHGVLVPLERGRPTVSGLGGGPALAVGALLWRSCLACFRDVWPLRNDASEDSPSATASLALGALAASEALRLLVEPPALSRLTILDLAHGTAVVKEIAPTGCEACGGPA